MAHRIRCCTLFDITYTGVSNRTKPLNADITEWLYRRNTQCNFDTILQVISLRSQPEVINNPRSILFKIEEFAKFGFLYQHTGIALHKYWNFEFEVQHASVFENGVNELGSLYRDCEGVPMVICAGQNINVPTCLDTTPELKNIYFEVIQ